MTLKLKVQPWTLLASFLRKFGIEENQAFIPSYFQVLLLPSD